MSFAFRFPFAASVYAFAAVCMLSPTAKADYILTPSSGGSQVVNVTVGGSFTVDHILSSGAGDVSTSAIWRDVFSSAGLTLSSYAWQSPYSNGTANDDSNPLSTALPVTLSDTTHLEPGQNGIVDTYSSNFLDSGTFGVGNLLSMTFQVPLNWSGPNQLTITTVPDTFANGFTEILTTAGQALVVNISAVPEPVSAHLAFAGLIATVPTVRRYMRRRQQRF